MLEILMNIVDSICFLLWTRFQCISAVKEAIPILGVLAFVSGAIKVITFLTKKNRNMF